MIGFGQQTYVPDDSFEQKLIQLGYDNVLDNFVLTAAIDTVTSLHLSGFDNGPIYNIIGIEDFTALESFSSSDNYFGSIDLSNSTALTHLSCGMQGLSSVNVSNNTALTHLTLAYNGSFASIDLSQNTALIHLAIFWNQLTSLDVSNNTALEYLDCDNNNLTSLDVSHNPSLTTLDCSGNPLTILDVRNGNNINFNLFYAINNPNLTCIDVDDPVYSTANWTNIDAASSFSANCDPNGCTDPLAFNYDPLATIDDGSCTYMTYVPDDNFENQLEANGMGDGVWLNDYVLTGNINTVTSLDVDNDNIDDLTGIEDFTALNHLSCNDNNLISLDVSQNTNLTYLDCKGNQLTSLDVSGATALTYLECKFNSLTTLDLSQHFLLTHLECQLNLLTNLDLSYTQLTTLKAKQNYQLTRLDLRNINLNNLDLSVHSNPQLFCIDVDDMSLATALFNYINNDIDPWTSFSTNCTLALGCTDSLACNYNPLATINDSSCVYPVIWQQAFSICDGDSIIVGNSIYNTIGNYIDTLAALNGCDSIVYTNISMLPPSVWQWGTAICDGDSVVVGTSVYDTIGNYIDTLAALNGCDSIVYTNISMLPPSVWQWGTAICDGDSVVVGTSVYDTIGNYTDTLTALNGCDSIVYTNISMLPPSVWQWGTAICDGDSVVVGASVYDTIGNYTDTLTALNGCDSIVYTNISIDYNTSSYDTLSVTASIVWNGMPLNVSGDYSVTLINSVGCDSIVNLNLIVTTTGISEIANNKSNLVKITDVLGQETPHRRNTPLFYIYDDGTVEKRIVIE